MRTTTLIIMMLLSLTNKAQHLNDTEYFTMALSVDPYSTIKEGLINANAEIEYVGTIYAKLGIETHTGLDINYLDVHAATGLNLMLNRFDEYRAYAGVRFGRIWREDKAIVPFVGFESGLDVNVSDSFLIGLRATYDHRTEGDFLGYDRFWRYSGYIRIGIRF